MVENCFRSNRRVYALLFVWIYYVGALWNYTVEVKGPSWAEVIPSGQSKPYSSRGMRHRANEIVSIPVYVSLTSVSFRVKSLINTLRTILDGIVIPTHVYVFLSRDPHLLDKGFKQVPDSLLTYMETGLVSIVYTNNIGPHRKLLPILDRFYDEDVLIITIDDDMSYQRNSTLVYQLLKYYAASDGNSVVALRARRIGFCASAVENASSPAANKSQLSVNNMFTTYTNWDVHYVEGRKEMFVLPTGTGGVLYRPRFFHPIVFDPIFRATTGTTDDLMFRLACMATNTTVLIACRDLERKNKIVRRCPVDTAFEAPAFAASSGSNASADLAQTVQRTSSQPTSMHKNRATDHHRNLRASLYGINVAGRNDAQWRSAISLLQQRGILNMTALFLAHYREREAHCYAPAANSTSERSANRGKASGNETVAMVAESCCISRCGRDSGNGKGKGFSQEKGKRLKWS